MREERDAMSEDADTLVVDRLDYEFALICCLRVLARTMGSPDAYLRENAYWAAWQFGLEFMSRHPLGEPLMEVLDLIKPTAEHDRIAVPLPGDRERLEEVIAALDRHNYTTLSTEQRGAE
jgi:hypothetical protein